MTTLDPAPASVPAVGLTAWLAIQREADTYAVLRKAVLLVKAMRAPPHETRRQGHLVAPVLPGAHQRMPNHRHACRLAAGVRARTTASGIACLLPGCDRLKKIIKLKVAIATPFSPTENAWKKGYAAMSATTERMDACMTFQRLLIHCQHAAPPRPVR